MAIRRLTKAQRERLILWVAEGLRSDEINKRASEFDPPFVVSPRTVAHYRKTRRIDIDHILAEGEHNALSTGLALRSERVKKLKALALRLERDLLGDERQDYVWTDQVKSVGSGPAAEIVEYEEFNRSEIDAYRGILDDIAKEMGDRRDKPGDTVVNVSFDLDEWKKSRSARLEAVEALEDEECGTQDAQG